MHTRPKNESSDVFKLSFFPKFSITVCPSRARANITNEWPVTAQFYTVLSFCGDVGEYKKYKCTYTAFEVYYTRCNKYGARARARAVTGQSFLPTTTTWPKTWSLDTWEQFQRWCRNWCRHSRRPSAAPSPTAGMACGAFLHCSRWLFANPGIRLQTAAPTTIAPTTLKQRDPLKLCESIAV